MKLSIIIPVFNEIQSIGEILFLVQAVDLGQTQKEVLVIEDCSNDGSKQFLEAIVKAQSGNNESITLEPGKMIPIHNIKIIFQGKNQGKGAAIRRGFSEATGDYVIIQDADLEYDPADYPKLLEGLSPGKAEVVYGTRFKNGEQSFYRTNYLANRFLTAFSNFMSGQSITDMETCYKLIPKGILSNFEIQQNRFGFEPEITAKIARQKIKIIEIPISYKGRTFQEGKKIGWKDGLNAIWCILRYNLFS